MTVVPGDAVPSGTRPALARWALILICWALVPVASHAGMLRIGGAFCYAVTSLAQPDHDAVRLSYRCGGVPRDYQQASLWLKAEPASIVSDIGGTTLLLHQTRFDRLVVQFAYADGMSIRSVVRRGDFGRHWRVGGYLAFPAPTRAAPLVGLFLRFDRLASHDLVRARAEPSLRAGQRIPIAAALIGAALALLALGAGYNLCLAWMIGRQFLAWQGAWAATMFVWGVLWSQLALTIVPGAAGTAASQISTTLSCLAVAWASFSAATALDRQAFPRGVRIAILGSGLLMMLAAAPLAVTSARLDLVGPALMAIVLVDLAAVTIAYIVAWRRGNGEARDILLAWIVPMVVLGVVEVVDVSDRLFGGGSQIAVLFASAWQTAWIAFTTSRRLGRFRIERDAARAAEVRSTALAGRDPLTGLLNRRGFASRSAEVAAGLASPDAPTALLLIDIDNFKAVNDRFGHEAGDAVLCVVAGLLALLEDDSCIPARIGGEEFALLVFGFGPVELEQLCEAVRRMVEVADYPDFFPGFRVTVSIGVAEGAAMMPFHKLYGMADRPLYDAKASGRNRVAWHAGGDPTERAALARDQYRFDWTAPVPMPASGQTSAAAADRQS